MRGHALILVNFPKQHWTIHVGQAARHPAAFLGVVAFGRFVVGFQPGQFRLGGLRNAGDFLMTMFIQRANRRDSLALHAKLSGA